MTRPSGRSHNRGWRAWAPLVVGLSLVGVIGLGVAWSWRDPWPARVVIRPSRQNWPGGFAANGRSYRTSGAGGVARWDVATGREVGLDPLPTVWGQAPADDGRTLAGLVLAGDPATLAVAWVDAASGAIRARFPIPPGYDYAQRPRLVAGGRAIRATLVRRDRGRAVATWDLATGAETRREVGGPATPTGWRVEPIAVAPDGQIWAYPDPAHGGIVLWDPETDRPRGPYLAADAGMVGDPARAAFGPDGRTLAVGEAGGRVGLWDVANGRQLWSAPAYPAGHMACEFEFSPDGRLLATVGLDLGLGWRGWARDQFNRRAPAAWSLPDGRGVVVLDVATGAVIARSPGSIHPQFSPDGRTVATHEADGTFSLRDLPRP